MGKSMSEPEIDSLAADIKIRKMTFSGLPY